MFSEKGNRLRIRLPWRQTKVTRSTGVAEVTETAEIELETATGETPTFAAAA